MSDAHPRGSTAPAPLQVGDVVADRFELVEVAGAGGMGTVYRALDRATGRACALKILRRESGDLERFEREATVLEKLSHPSIVAYVAHGTTDAGDAWLAMEWAVGRTLRDVLDERTLTPREVVDVAARVADALSVAHAAGIIHRDLKPSNLMLRLSDDGRIEGLQVLDFGVARARGGDGDELTITGQMIGTPGYMAPEQARGQKDIDARADVFALGCVMFRAIAGRPAFEAEDVLAVLTLLALYEPPLLGDVADGVPDELEALVSRMLAKEKARRPAGAGEVLEALERVRALGDDAWRRAARGAKTAPQKRKRVELEVGEPPEIGEDSTLADRDPLARPHPALVGKEPPERAPEEPAPPRPREAETMVSVTGRTLVLRPGRRALPIGVGAVAAVAATVLLWPTSSAPPAEAPAPSASASIAPPGEPPPSREILWTKSVRGVGASAVKAVAAGGDVVFVGADVRGAWAVGEPVQASGDAGPVQESLRGRDGVVMMLRRDGRVGWATPFTNGPKDVDVRAVETRGESVWVLGLFEGELAADGKHVSAAGAPKALDPAAPPARSSSGESTGLFLAELSALSGAVRSLRAFGELDTNFYLSKFGLALGERGVVIAGGYSGTLDLGCGKRTATDLDPFLARLDADGKCSWSPEMSGAGLQTIDSVGVDLAGDVVVAGEYTNTLRLSPSEPGGLAVDQRSSGGIDFFVIKFDPGGKVAWHQAWGAPLAVQGGATIAVHPLGAIGFAGWFEGSLSVGDGAVKPKVGSDVLVAALDPQGKPLFARPLGLERDACPKDRCLLDHLGVAMDGDGNVSVAAPFSGTATLAPGAAVTSSGETDLLVATFAPTGALVAALRAGDGAAQCQPPRCWYALTSDLDGGLYAAGWFAGTLARGFGATAGNEDGFLLRMGRPDR